MFHRRRKIRYYNGPERTDKLIEKVWFPFAAVAVAALVFGLVLGAILGGVAKNSKYARLSHHDLSEFGGVENPNAKYATLMEIRAQTVDPAGMDAAQFRSTIWQMDGNAVGILLFDGNPHFDGGEQVGYDGTGKLGVEEMVQLAADKNCYSVGYFTVKSFTESSSAKRTYEKGRELSLLSDIVASGIRELIIFGLPADEILAKEVSLYIAQIRDFSTTVTLGVGISAGESDAAIARLVAATQENVDSYVLDLRTESSVETAIERNAYYLSQYHMRTFLAEDSEVVEAYGIKSYLLWEK